MQTQLLLTGCINLELCSGSISKEQKLRITCNLAHDKVTQNVLSYYYRAAVQLVCVVKYVCQCHTSLQLERLLMHSLLWIPGHRSPGSRAALFIMPRMLLPFTRAKLSSIARLQSNDKYIKVRNKNRLNNKTCQIQTAGMCALRQSPLDGHIQVF